MSCRTPLSSILGFAELLTQTPVQPGQDARMQRYAQNILTSGRSLLDLINDLLDLAKIEAGKMEVHLSEFSLGEVCEGLYDFMKPLADKAGLQFELQLANDLPRMNSDAGKIKQVLYNLLSNAVKFTQPAGRVTFAAGGWTASACRLRWKIQDRAFRRTSRRRSSRSSGSSTRERPGGMAEQGWAWRSPRIW